MINECCVPLVVSIKRSYKSLNIYKKNERYINRYINTYISIRDWLKKIGYK